MNKEIDAYTIPLLKQPDKLGKALIPIAKLMTEEMASKPDWDYKTGNLPTPNFPRPLNIYFDIWAFLMDSNEIIANLNLVLSDLKMLQEDPVFFQKQVSGDPVLRYKLLARTYFYEFFRFKECFTFFLARLRKINCINSKHAKEIKSLFYFVFEPALNIRNTMIHNRFLWAGEGHQRLCVTLSAESVGGTVIDKKTGAIYDKTKILSDIADDTIQMFLDEGVSVKSYFEDIVESITEMVHKSEGLPEV
ncbi:MAG: hypothetical protein SWH54_10785 [Thermodesulfobacteriota bacterium]|nr:hypothetical protein [Thermodesulfobacteriota bacterium]